MSALKQDNHRKMGEQGLGEHIGSPLRAVIQWLKTMSTNEYIRGVKQNGWQPFHGKLWQHNYYEHIIRDENELNRIREYIINNPLQWEFDQENPMVKDKKTGDSMAIVIESEMIVIKHSRK